MFAGSRESPRFHSGVGAVMVGMSPQFRDPFSDWPHSVIAVSCLANQGQEWGAAVQCLSDMQSTEVEPDIISYNATISACEKGEEWQLALQLLFHMPSADQEHDVISFNSTMSACAACSEWQLVLQLFQAMQAKQLTPDEVTYGTTISACVMPS